MSSISQISLYIKTLLVLAVLFCFVILDSLPSLIPWGIFLLLGIHLTRRLNENKSIYQFPFCYCVFSLLGLLICIDNQFHFNSLYGYARDDYRFFNDIRTLASGLDAPGANALSYVLMPFAFIVMIFRDLSLLDLLPFNWMLLGLIVIWIDRISLLLLKKHIPLYIMAFCFVFRFAVWDTVFRLYRDNLILIIILVSFYSLLNSKKKKFWLISALVIPFRAASFSFPLLFYFYNLIANFTIRKKIFLTTLILALFFVFFNSIIPLVSIYGSGLNNVGRYEEAFSDLSTSDFIAMRNSAYGENSSYQMFAKNDVVGVSGRILIMLLFPLKLLSFNNPISHFALGPVPGYYFSNIYLNISAFTGVFTFFLLLFNIKKIIQQRVMLNMLCPLAIFLFFIVLISNQYRHLLPFYALLLIPINYVDSLISRKQLLKYSVLAILIVIAYSTVKSF